MLETTFGILATAARIHRPRAYPLEGNVARGMILGMKRDYKNWNWYINAFERKLIHMVRNDASRIYPPDTSSQLLGLINRVKSRNIRIFAFYSLNDYVPLARICFFILMGTTKRSEKNNDELARRLGLELVERYDKDGTRASIRNRYNHIALKRIFDDHFDRGTGRLRIETVDRLLDDKISKTEGIRKHRLQVEDAIKELELIFSNPRLVHDWAPGFPNMPA